MELATLVNSAWPSCVDPHSE